MHFRWRLHSAEALTVQRVQRWPGVHQSGQGARRGNPHRARDFGGGSDFVGRRGRYFVSTREADADDTAP